MLREVLARFGIDFDSAGIQAGVAGLANLAAAAAAAVAVIGIGLLVALRSLTLEMAQFGDETAKTARSLGIGANELVRWQFAAERAGVPAAQLTNGLRRLQRNLVDAGEGTETATRAFRAIGVSFQDANGEAREIEEILPDIADGFAGLSNDTERSARAQQLFGRAGAQLLPFFEGGSAGLQEMSDRFDELTGGSFGDFFDRAEEAQDSLADFELATTAVKATLATELLPVLTTVVTAVADMVGFFNQVTEGTRPFRVVILALGLALGSIAAVVSLVLLPVLSPLILIFAIWAAAIAAVVLLVDDLLTLFEGGDSVIGRFLDAMFGVGTAASVAEAVQAAWASFVGWVTAVAVPRLVAFGRFLVGLWPMIRPGLRTLGRFITGTFSFLSTLPSRVRAFLKPIGEFFGDLEVRVSAFFASIASRFATLRDDAAGVLGFFGVEVGGAPAATAGAPSATVRREGGSPQTIAQTNEITINGTDLSADELTRSVREALEAASARALRVAERALTTEAG